MEFLGFISMKLSSNDLAHSVSSFTETQLHFLASKAKATHEGSRFSVFIPLLVYLLTDYLAIYTKCTSSPTFASTLNNKEEGKPDGEGGGWRAAQRHCFEISPL